MFGGAYPLLFFFQSPYHKEQSILDRHKNNGIVPCITVKDIQRSLDFYTATLGLQLIDTLILRDGRIVHASVGFDSTLLMIRSQESLPNTGTSEDMTTNKAGIGVELCIRMNGSQRLEDRSAKSLGTPVTGQKRRVWSENVYAVTDPDGYALSITERIHATVPQKSWVKVGRPQRSERRRNPFVSLFSSST